MVDRDLKPIFVKPDTHYELFIYKAKNKFKSIDNVIKHFLKQNKEDINET